MTLSPGQEMTLTLINYTPSLALVVSIEQLSSQDFPKSQTKPFFYIGTKEAPSDLVK